MISGTGFNGSPLQRLERPRTDPILLARYRARADALMLLLDDYIPVARGEQLTWVPLPAVPPEELIFLGLIEDTPRFAHLIPGAAGAKRAGWQMDIIAGLAFAEAGTYATARSLLDWHARHRFCANCGMATDASRAGWARLCPHCATEHFPRTDPVVIMLAQHGNGESARVLIGRQPSFPPKRYSALAGFIEVGESIEGAVTRELEEEAGVKARDVRYLASQPWPFPSQLMIACLAHVDDDALTLDKTELEDAQWVTRDQVRSALASAPDAVFVPPPAHAIAMTLLQLWLASEFTGL